ncbi:S8 family serine peptidase [Streptomonospora sp. S1-112]|uniref:S8 family serine peptidase n=1 Tax=Streptomonospora mangrovi TaxID=2883123 RepID=A0A9X3NT12_9ACTN|nr:S8 family serine peptidase [Streptomonospora mangrovi]MDA0567661.1 S8 family serine peptidase [Streptomonospora mangrovi]
MTPRKTGFARPRLRALTRAAGAAVALALVLPPAPAGASPSAEPSASPSPSPSASPSQPAALPPITPFMLGASGDDACVAAASTTVEETPWTHVSLGLDAVHRLTKGAGTTVAVLAGGVAADGPLADAVRGGAGADCRGYGTFLAGVVAARPEQGSGFVGVAPEARIVGVATGDPRSGVATPAEIASSLNDAVADGADVVLVGAAAWENSGRLDDAVAAAVEADVLVVAPASVTPESQPLAAYPAQDPAVLSVGSYDPEGAPAAASPPAVLEGDEAARTDVMAPGTQVMGVGPGGGHFVSGGDGVAAAFAAGTAALVRARHPDLSAEQVRERVIASAYGAMPGAEPEVVGRGPVDPMAALTGSPEGAEAAAPAGGGRFTPDPPSRGTWNVPVTVAVAGGSALLILVCVLGAVVLRRGRARGWRPATGQPATPGTEGERG